MIENMNKVSTFTVTPYGNLEQISPTISKCRLRIFYTGMTRNRTFITEDVANNLILTLPYTPIKGIVNEDNNDYTDHGENNDEGRIYGIVPSDPHFGWESHLDNDNVTRTYGCCDVYLFTALYPNAPEILGKPQSMELYTNTLQGNWLIAEDGLPYFKYDHCDFIGLQVLGTDVEPCFEGAAFYTLCKDDTVIDYIKKYIEKKEGEKEMTESLDISKFQISDEEKTNLIFKALNPAFNCETGEGVAYAIVATYDNYVLVCTQNWEYERIYYTRTEDGNSIELGEHVPVKLVDVTAEEEQALDTMKAAGNGSFTTAVENYTEKDEALKAVNNTLEEERKNFTDAKINFESQIASLNSEIESLKESFTIEDKKNEITEDKFVQKEKEDDKDSSNSDVDSIDSKTAEEDTDEKKSDEDGNKKKKPVNSTLADIEYKDEINAIKAENERLSNLITEKEAEFTKILAEKEKLVAFKKSIDDQEKKNLIAKFEKILSEEEVNKFLTEIDNYTVEDLNKELSVTAFTAHPDFLSGSKQKEDVSFIPKSNIINKENLSPEERLIEQYKGGMK